MNNEPVTDEGFANLFRAAARNLARLPKSKRIEEWKKASAQIEEPEVQTFINTLFCFADLLENAQ